MGNGGISALYLRISDSELFFSPSVHGIVRRGTMLHHLEHPRVTGPSYTPQQYTYETSSNYSGLSATLYLSITRLLFPISAI